MSSTDAHPTKRPRMRDRTTLACTGCKERKLKCDGQSPKCQTCRKSNRECLVEDPVSGLHRPRDYLQSLEARVVYLESLLQREPPDVASATGASPSPPYVQPAPSEDVVSPGAHTVRPVSMTHSDDQQIDRLSSEVALLCLSAAGREPHYFGPSSAVSFSRIVSATMGLAVSEGTTFSTSPSVEPERDDGDSQGRDPRRDAPPLCLPSPNTASRLVQAYFANIHLQYPFLHRPTFGKWHEEVRSALEYGETEDVAKFPLFFVLMVYAIGSATLGQQHQKTAELYYASALDHIEIVLSSNDLQSIQGILCCAVYSIRSPVGVSLWKVSGMAIRHCIELGYHRSTNLYHRDTDSLTKELIKRCFWVAYDIDRVTAFTLGRPLGIPEECIDVELPTDIEDEHILPSGFTQSPRNPTENPPTGMSGALHVIHLRRLWAKFNTTLYIKRDLDRECRDKLVNNLRRELDDWRASIPDQFSVADSRPLSVFSSSEWFQLAYDQSILLLYRPYITEIANWSQRRTRNQSDIGNMFCEQAEAEDTEAINRAFEECSVRSREMCLLYRRLHRDATIQLTWGSLHILFLGGLTYLYCLWQSQRVRSMTRQTDVVSTCMACSTVLVIIAERWHLATSYRDLFETLSERTINMVFGDGNLSRSDQQATSKPIAPSAAWNDWYMGLENISIPPETEWLVYDLLQCDSQFLSQTFPNFQEPYGFTTLRGVE